MVNIEEIPLQAKTFFSKQNDSNTKENRFVEYVYMKSNREFEFHGFYFHYFSLTNLFKYFQRRKGNDTYVQLDDDDDGMNIHKNESIHFYQLVS